MERYPLTWPVGVARTKQRIDSRFGQWDSKPTVSYASQSIVREIELLTKHSLKKDKIFISTNVKLRLDGLPKSGQKQPEDPGAAVYFDYNKKPIVISCDKYRKVGCNLWAIAKTIEAMRGIERWGCSDFLERSFTGFQALPEQAGESNGFVHPWQLLGLSEKPTDIELAKTAYRNMARKYHGVDDHKMAEINNAWKQVQEYLI